VRAPVSMGWFLVIVGLVITAIGLLWVLAPSMPWLGKLPGDIRVERDGFSFYFPVVTCLLLSVLVSLVVWLIRALRG
jgi:DUF2905 family protein